MFGFLASCEIPGHLKVMLFAIFILIPIMNVFFSIVKNRIWPLFLILAFISIFGFMWASEISERDYRKLDEIYKKARELKRSDLVKLIEDAGSDGKITSFEFKLIREKAWSLGKETSKYLKAKGERN